MRAIEYATFGDPEVLRLVTRPERPLAADRVRVRVRAVSVNPKDVLLRKGRLRFLPAGRLPRVPGFDLAGEVLDGPPGAPRGATVWGMRGGHAGGALAEHVDLAPREWAIAPPGVEPGLLAAVPLAGLTAWQALVERLRLARGEHLLVHGAVGGVGHLAVQLGRALGARVTAVCSADGAALARSLGADQVLDRRQDWAARAGAVDALFDAYGTLRPARVAPLLGRHGRMCTTVPAWDHVGRALLARGGLGRFDLVVVRPDSAQLRHLGELMRQGLLRPVLAARFPWTDAAAAHRLLETRGVHGKVVLDLP